MGHIYPTGEIRVEQTSYVITLPDNKRQYVRGYPLYYGRWGHRHNWMGPFTNIPDLARRLGESPDAIKYLIESGEGVLGPIVEGRVRLVGGNPEWCADGRYRPALYNVIRGRIAEVSDTLRWFLKKGMQEQNVAAADQEQAEGAQMRLDELIAWLEGTGKQPPVDVEAERRKANVGFARYCLKGALFRYRDRKRQVALAKAILSVGTFDALREAVGRIWRGLEHAISTHYSDPQYGWEAGVAELEEAYAQMRTTLAAWAEAVQSNSGAQEAIRRERKKLSRIPDSRPDKQEHLQALSEKGRIEREKEYVVAGAKMKGGQLQFAFLTLNLSAFCPAEVQELFLRATDPERYAILKEYHDVLRKDRGERIKLKLIHSIARNLSTWEGVANSAHDLSTRAGCLAVLADDSIAHAALPFVRQYWGPAEVAFVLAPCWLQVKRVILAWRTRLDEALKESPGRSAIQVQQALEIELVASLKQASRWADVTSAVKEAREKQEVATALQRGTPQEQFVARIRLAVRDRGEGVADFGDARKADLRGVSVHFPHRFREIRGLFDHAKLSKAEFGLPGWADLRPVVFSGSYRHVDFTQSSFAGVTLDGDCRGAKLEGAKFFGCHIGPSANFNGVDLSKISNDICRERLVQHGTFKGAKLGKLGNKVFADKKQIAGAKIPKSARGGILTGRQFRGMRAFALFNPGQHDSIGLAKRSRSWDNLCFDAPNAVVKTRALIGIYDGSRVEVRGTPDSVLDTCSLNGADVLCQGQTLYIRYSDIRGAAISAPVASDVVFCPQTTLADRTTKLDLPKVRRIWAEVEGKSPAAFAGPSDTLSRILNDILHGWNSPAELKALSAKLKEPRSWVSKAVKEAWKESEAAKATARKLANAESPPAEPAVTHPQAWIASLIDPRIAELMRIQDPEAEQAKLIGALPIRLP
jgi:uncharacterized protein YjbI with pentapeptide repeats